MCERTISGAGLSSDSSGRPITFSVKINSATDLESCLKANGNGARTALLDVFWNATRVFSESKTGAQVENLATLLKELVV